MDAKLKRKWVAALRSGQYKQGRDYLYRGGRYCCLGVLCEIQGFNWRRLPPDYRVTVNLPDGFDAGLGPIMRGRLAHMNDDGKSFPDIADYIEREL